MQLAFQLVLFSQGFSVSQVTQSQFTYTSNTHTSAHTNTRKCRNKYTNKYTGFLGQPSCTIPVYQTYTSNHYLHRWTNALQFSSVFCALCVCTVHISDERIPCSAVTYCLMLPSKAMQCSAVHKLRYGIAPIHLCQHQGSKQPSWDTKISLNLGCVGDKEG